MKKETIFICIICNTTQQNCSCRRPEVKEIFLSDHIVNLENKIIEMSKRMNRSNRIVSIEDYSKYF